MKKYQLVFDGITSVFLVYYAYMLQSIPDTAKKYFWGDDLSDLSWTKHQRYIVQTLLEKGNISSLRWLFKNISKNEVKNMLPTLRLQKKSSNFWGIYLS